MTTKTIEQKLAATATELRRAKRVLFITGAGISADSGLPTYRGVGGLYNTKTTEEGYSIEQCLSASMFRVRPDITWKYMLRIGEAVIQCQPNSAHEVIARWEKEFARRSGNVIVLTQNIDGYHRLAGSENVLEIHGNLGELFCTKCSWETSVDLSTDNCSSLAERLKEYDQDSVPRCPKCQAVIRPRIVMFEEMLPHPVLTQFSEEFDNGNGFDMFFSIGTSAMFPYIILTTVRNCFCFPSLRPLRKTFAPLAVKILPQRTQRMRKVREAHFQTVSNILNRCTGLFIAARRRSRSIR